MVHAVKEDLLGESNPQSVGSSTKGRKIFSAKGLNGKRRKKGQNLPATRGRPVEPLAEHVAAEIEAWLHRGYSLRKLCEQPGMPQPVTICNWVQKHPAFAERFARARDGGADSLVDEAQDIADALTRDDRKPTSEEVQAAKLQCEMRWKRAACFRPSKYGQKAMLEHAGAMSIQVVTGVPARRPSQPILAEAATSQQDAPIVTATPNGTVTRIIEASAAYAVTDEAEPE
jgi:hypothetical protein